MELPKIDLSGLKPGSDAWDAARTSVMRAFELYGGFDAVSGAISPELREELFDNAMGEAFRLPLSTKLHNGPESGYNGYLGQNPNEACEGESLGGGSGDFSGHWGDYQSFRVNGATTSGGVERFTRLLWPEGNANFRDVVYSFASLLKELEQMVERMILESMGLHKYCHPHIGSIAYGLRLSEYGVRSGLGCELAMKAHTDPTLMTIICQHEVDGLEVETRQGEWIHVAPSPNSVTFMLGDFFEAWTNGRLKATSHRVKASNKTRYSTVFSSFPADGYILQAPKELVDEKHPLIYGPCNHTEYLRFRLSDEGMKAEKALYEFCGVRGENVN